MDTQRCQNHGPVRLLVPLLEFNLADESALDLVDRNLEQVLLIGVLRRSETKKPSAFVRGAMELQLREWGSGIALSFHWWVWLLFLLASSLPYQLEPATRRQSHFRSRQGLFHTYSVWIFLGLTIFWLPTGTLTVSGIP